MAKVSKETRIKRARKELGKIFADLDEKRAKIAENLIDKAAFMTVTLEDLQEEISKNGCVSEYQNGENQFGTKKSPEVEVYNTMIKNYTQVVKQLCDMLPEAASREASALAEWHREGIAGRRVV